MLSVVGLLAEYRSSRRSPSEIAAATIESIAQDDAPVWITRVSDKTLLDAARMLDTADRALPLYGVPFAVKDNIDVAGLPTSAGCPGYAALAQRTAPVVLALLDAGALLIGKTNMDQFATGLVGTRSPYGACSSVSDPIRVSGGSSSGSALAVARGHVAFALGTDTAGSGRVPAAFNGLVGVKPTRGLLSTRGVVPACASLDCVSILAASVGDAAAVLDLTASYDAQDPWSRRDRALTAGRTGRIGVPLHGQGEPDEPAAAQAWADALQRAAQQWTVASVDVSALLDAAPLLYGIWIAERTAHLGSVIATAPEGLDPIVAAIIGAGAQRSAVEVFAATHQLAALRRTAAQLWDEVDALLLPTAVAHPTHAEVAADPIGVNERLGRLTNFVNLMDLAALAVPGPERADGLPFGVTLIAPAFHDRRLLELGAQWCEEATSIALRGTVRLAVAGAHMSGLPLSERLTARGARLVKPAVTAPCYRLYELAGDGVRRPGLIRVPDGGASIEVEVWEIAPAALGALVGEVPAPLAIGRVTLDDGDEIAGFVCEGSAGDDARDITNHGSWRAYIAAVTS
ncbi:MAG: allophanate hydrolase [Solirubrobacteraceae bacterium]